MAFDVCINKFDVVVVEFKELDDEDVVGGVTLAVHMSCIRSLSKAGGANCGDWRGDQCGDMAKTAATW